MADPSFLVNTFGSGEDHGHVFLAILDSKKCYVHQCPKFVGVKTFYKSLIPDTEEVVFRDFDISFPSREVDSHIPLLGSFNGLPFAVNDFLNLRFTEAIDVVENAVYLHGLACRM